MNIKLADRLVELRKENKLSQEALAEKLGLSRQAVSKWERAEASPDTDNLIALAELYGITLDRLLGNNEQKTEPQPIQEKQELTKNQLKGKKRLLVAPLLFLLAIVVYVGVGMLVGKFWWALMWILFPLVIGYTFSALTLYFENKRGLSIFFSTIAITLFAISLYIVLGIEFRLWNIAWLVFLLIPAHIYIKIIKK